MSTTPYLDRARDINRRMIASTELHNTRHAMKLIGAGLLFSIAGLTVGIAVPFNQPVKTYDLVQFHGLESDIIDYDLSIGDCATIIPTMRSTGADVDCRSSSY